MSYSFLNSPQVRPLVVGSIGDRVALKNASPKSLALECDIAEVRLDLLHQDVMKKGRKAWEHLLPFPLLFTARCKEEGSPFNLDISLRTQILHHALPDAAMIDIEVASLPFVGDLLHTLREKNIPWVGSFHDFDKLPKEDVLHTKFLLAKNAGAHTFKVAAHLDSIQSLADLANFQKKYGDASISSMGMGVLAPVSRMLCAQAGSILNYGYIGNSPTAPGQWSAGKLKEAIQSLLPFES